MSMMKIPKNSDLSRDRTLRRRLSKKGAHFKTFRALSGLPAVLVVAYDQRFGYIFQMDETQDAAHYRQLINKAESYHDLVIFRSRYFSLLERTLPKEDFLELKSLWTAKAAEENLPVAPNS